MKSGADPFQNFIDWNEYKDQNNASPSQTTGGVNVQADPSFSQNVPIGDQGNAPTGSNGIVASLLKIPGLAKDAIEHPIQSAQDFGAGVMGGAQRLGSSIGEAAEIPTHFAYEQMTGNKVPHFNVREAMGLGKDRPFDLKQKLQSDNANPLALGLGQFVGNDAISVGRKGLANTLASGAIWGASQGDPGERLNSAAIGVAGNAVPYGLGQTGKGIKAGYNYLNPTHDASKLIEDLGGGAKTAEENLAITAQRMKFARKSAEQEALTPKRELMSAYGNEKLTNNSYQNNPNVTDYYNKGLNRAHEEFVNNPTLENSDSLMSKLSKEIRKLEERQQNKTLDSTGDDKLEVLKENKDNLLVDHEALIKTLPQKYQSLYQDFRVKWAKNVAPYDSLGRGIRQMSKTGNANGVKPTILNSKFAFPNDAALKIGEDLGQSGQNNLLFNHLRSVKPGDTQGLAEAILNAGRTQGYQKWMPPGLEESAVNLAKRAKLGKKVGDTAATVGGAGLGMLGGHPYIGAALGYTAKNGVIPAISKYLAKGLKK